MTRYHPFSHDLMLRDEPMPRSGSPVLCFLEPKDYDAASGDRSSQATQGHSTAEQAPEDEPSA